MTKTDEIVDQPLEVVKTTMAANRTDGFVGSMARIWGRGGVLGCKLDLFTLKEPMELTLHDLQSIRVLSHG
jgi:hypothetical protein